MATGAFPAARLRQAGVSAARITAIQTTYNGWTGSQQHQFRAWIATNPDETIRRTYDPDGPGYTPPASSEPLTPAQLAASPEMRVAFGAYVGLGTTDDTVHLNNLLAAGGLVKGTPGQTYTITAPLVIGSGTTLDMTGCVIQLHPDAVQGTMLIDTGHNAMLYGGGTWTAPERITVLGGHWRSGSVQGAVVNGRHRMILGGNRLTIRGCRFSSTSGKYQLCLQNVSDFVVDDVFMDTVESDGVHLQGPAVRGRITGVRGTSHDDLVSITPVDWPQYTWGNEGDVTDILIDGVQAVNCLTAIVKVLSGSKAGAPVTTARVTVRNVTGNLVPGANFGATAAVYVGDDTAQANTKGGQLQDVLVDGVSVATTPGIPIVYVPGDAGSRPITSLTLRNVFMRSDCTAAVQIDGGNIATLTVDGVTGGTATAPIVDAIIWFVNAGARVDRIRLANVDLTFAGAKDGAFVKAPWASNGLSDVAVLNARTANVAQGWDLGTTTRVRLVNVRMVGNDILGNARASAVVTLGGTGIDIDGTWIQRAAGAVLIPRAFDMPIGLTWPEVQGAVGNRCYNTDGGAAGGVGPCMHTGTAWVRVA